MDAIVGFMPGDGRRGFAPPVFIFRERGRNAVEYITVEREASDEFI